MEDAIGRLNKFLSVIESSPHTCAAFPSLDDRVKLCRYIVEVLSSVYTELENGTIVLESKPNTARMIGVVVTKQNMLKKEKMVCAPSTGNVDLQLDAPERDFVFHFRVVAKSKPVFSLTISMPLDPKLTFGSKWEEINALNLARHKTHGVNAGQTLGRPDVCGGCGSTGGKMLHCVGCDFIWYCSRECELSNWAVHKPSCIAVAKISKPTSTGVEGAAGDGASGSGT